MILILISAFGVGYGQVVTDSSNLREINAYTPGSSQRPVFSYKTAYPKAKKLMKDDFFWDPTAAHHFYDVWPCIIIGQLKQKGELYNFEVNGGSWLYMKSKDTTIILGDYNTDDKKYFISTPTRN